mmetsp:Transcript_55408/g.131584  ORF Transcript_55408/g.131584 Transcript_55408/m.131584 type:complete len:212 (-) Transcript_55408:378-1013(-)
MPRTVHRLASRGLHGGESARDGSSFGPFPRVGVFGVDCCFDLPCERLELGPLSLFEVLQCLLACRLSPRLLVLFCERHSLRQRAQHLLHLGPERRHAHPLRCLLAPPSVPPPPRLLRHALRLALFALAPSRLLVPHGVNLFRRAPERLRRCPAACGPPLIAVFHPFDRVLQVRKRVGRLRGNAQQILPQPLDLGRLGRQRRVPSLRRRLRR